MELERIATREDIDFVFNHYQQMKRELENDTRNKKLREELANARKLLRAKQEAIEKIHKLSTKYGKPFEAIDEINRIAKSAI